MSRVPKHAGAGLKPALPDKERELRLDRLLGRQVLAGNNRPVGRLEEFRAEQHRTGFIIIDYVIGAAGLFERRGGQSS